MAERTPYDPDGEPTAEHDADRPSYLDQPGPVGGGEEPAVSEELTTDEVDTEPTDLEDDPVAADKSPSRAPSRPRRTASSHNKWQVLGITAGALALALVLGWFGGILAGKAFGPEQPKSTAAATKSTDAKATGAGATPGESIKITGATLFDPPPGDGQENPDRLALSYDGQPGTTWPTLQYQGTASFGNIKPGVGIIYDLGSEKAISKVQIQTTLPGATVEVHAGTAPGGTLDQFPIVAGPVQLQETTDIPVPAGTKTRYVLVWITKLVPQQGYFQASLSEVGIIS